jgi:hypothetical protein
MINGNPEKKYAPQNTEPHWDKALPADTRRNLILKTNHGNKLAAAQALKTLANVTRDQEVRKLAATDAVYLLKMYQSYGKPHVASEPFNDGRLPENKSPEKNESE